MTAPQPERAGLACSHQSEHTTNTATVHYSGGRADWWRPPQPERAGPVCSHQSEPQTPLQYSTVVVGQTGDGLLSQREQGRRVLISLNHKHRYSTLQYITRDCSVPARLGKGQGAKEIRHNLACERQKFGQNLVLKWQKIGHSLEHERPKSGHNSTRERNEIWAQFCGRSMKARAQICKQFTVHRLPEGAKRAIICRNFFIIWAQHYVHQAGRTGARAGRSTLRNMPSWNTGLGWHAAVVTGVRASSWHVAFSDDATWPAAARRPPASRSTASR